MPRVRTIKYGESSFCYETAGVWNSLPIYLLILARSIIMPGSVNFELFEEKKTTF